MGRAAREPAGESDRLTKADWVRKAMEALSRGGVRAVRVEVLAKELEVTKGSFYWHFRDRNALLAEVLTTWRRLTTREAESVVEQKTSDPRERLRLLMELATASDRDDVPGGRLEQAIRQWAITSEAAAEALRQVDEDRLETLTELYRATGMRKSEASAYAFLLYAFTIGSNRITSSASRQAFQNLRQSVAEILTP